MQMNYGETDWLASKPVFFNTKTNIIGNTIQDVIDWNDFDFDIEGLINYLKFGYSVYGKTMVRNVFFLEPNSRCYKTDSGLIIEKKRDDYIYAFLEKQREINEVIELFENNVTSYLHNTSNIILPLSGGYDSRWLAYICRNQKKVKTYTYGLSIKQENSYEAVRAKRVSELCGLSNQLVELSDYHKYCDEWYDLMGAATHLHGMYQMEFYKKIIDEYKLFIPCNISGIYGDAFAGSVRMHNMISRPSDLPELGYSHGMNIVENITVKKISKNISEEAYWENNKELLNSENGRIILMIRMKMILLSYLLKVPENLGISTYAPFLDETVALSIMSLSWAEKTDRRWQKSYFEKIGLGIDELDRYDPYISINLQAYRRNKLKPLDSELLSEVISKDYVEQINKRLGKKYVMPLSVYKGTIKSQINKVVGRYNADFLKAYNAYLVLSPIERLILERNLKLRG